MTLWLGAKSPIGIDVGASCVKAAQLQRTRRGWRVTALAAFDRIERTDLPSAPEIDRLSEVLDRAGFAGADVVVGAPRSRLRSAVLDLPPRKSGAPLEQICQAEVSRMFRMTPGSYEMHAWEIPSLSSRSQLTQMAASALAWDDGAALASAFEAAGLRVAAIDLAPEALARACAPAMHDLPELSILIDLGDGGLDLVVFRGGDAVYQRRLEPFGIGWAIAAVARKLAVSERGAGSLVRRIGFATPPGPGTDATVVSRTRAVLREQIQSILSEVLSSVSYALDRFPGESVTALRLVGGGARMPGLADYIGEVSGLNVACLSPSSVARGLSSRPAAKSDPTYMGAIGHAMWGSAA